MTRLVYLRCKRYVVQKISRRALAGVPKSLNTFVDCVLLASEVVEQSISVH